LRESSRREDIGCRDNTLFTLGLSTHRDEILFAERAARVRVGACVAFRNGIRRLRAKRVAYESRTINFSAGANPGITKRGLERTRDYYSLESRGDSLTDLDPGRRELRPPCESLSLVARMRLDRSAERTLGGGGELD